jgi:SOS response regulatory protein OraA/RecX
VPKEFWQEALEGYPDQEDHILGFLRSKLGTDADERQRKRAIDALLRRGHSYSEIRNAMRQLDFDEFPEDYDG